MRMLLSLPVVLSLASLAGADSVDYLRDVKPILAKRCYACHGGTKQKMGLRLDTVTAALKGGDSGPAIVPGKSDASRLIHAVTGTHEVSLMPPKEPRLTAKEIALLRTWIDAGAQAPKDEVAEKTVVSKHWAFQPPRRVDPPSVSQPRWCRNPIDHFILARLDREKLTPAPEADRVTLIRRLSLDLLGLPPSLREVEEFVNDRSADAYEKLVDRLLASPHYGERWGRHWLDLARYADSNGYSIDAARSIWPYRDWVIDAFNRDMPFDRFTIAQLAGDLLPGSTRNDKVATGFHRNTMINQEGGIDREQFRVESIVDRVNTTGTVFLGLTVGCCQCHDHKFDPISQKEYYQLFAFLNNVDEPTIDLPTPEQLQKRAAMQKRIAQLEKMKKSFDTTSAAKQVRWEKNLGLDDVDRLPEELRLIVSLDPGSRDRKQKEKLTAYYRTSDLYQHTVGGFGVNAPLPLLALTHLHVLTLRQSVDRQIAALKKSGPEIPTTMIVKERATPRETYIQLGGDFTRKGKVVQPGVPAILPPLPALAKPTRLDLAKWLVDPKNPLTARVTMNRFWQRYFGLGLVETENDFGTQGTPPSHPELLDWLATEFMARQWSMKAMHRLIVTSATYRQASTVQPEAARVDPRNRLLARQNRIRLEAELVRDNALAVSGLLSRKIGGPSVFPPQPEGVYAFTQLKKNWQPSSGADRFRRGMYTFIWRSAPHPGLTVFDATDGTTTCTRRTRSNTPLQALTLLNDQAFYECAQALGVRALQESKGEDAARMDYLFRVSLARAPREREQQALLRFLTHQRETFQANPAETKKILPLALPTSVSPAEAAAWTMIGRVLLNLDEFITRE